MKIEKISDNQIRCTLSKEDLLDRQLRISELAYGTEKAKALFREMMQQASYEYGFEADDIPLMIEAIPLSPESLILVITKVEDPDELDTRFSKFSPDTEEDDSYFAEEDEEVYADEVLNNYNDLIESLQEDSLEVIEDVDQKNDNFVPLPEALGQKKSLKEVPSNISESNLTKVYSFDSLSALINLADSIGFFYHGINHAYKNPITSRYYLELSKSEHTPEEFNKVCNIISEYGKSERTTYASSSYYKEHFELIVKDNAIQVLSAM